MESVSQKWWLKAHSRVSEEAKEAKDEENEQHREHKAGQAGGITVGNPLAPEWF